MSSPQGRLRVLENAGLGDLAARIDLHGATSLAVSSIISDLAGHGRVSRENEALGLFLNEVKALTGLEDQQFLGQLMNEHSMMVPVANTPPMQEWLGRSTDSQVAEKIIGANTLRPVNFLSRGFEVSHSVGLITVRGPEGAWSGTGFLLTPDLLITNAHVLPQIDLLSRTDVRFNYEDDRFGRPCEVRSYQPKPNGMFHNNTTLDYALVELDGRPGDKWGWLPYNEVDMTVGQRVNIIQHPGGRPKEVAIQSNFVEYIADNVVQYITATEPGSSGSPVFDDDWRVCSVHCRGGDLVEPGTGRPVFRNEGVLLSSVVADLPAAVRARLSTQ